MINDIDDDCSRKPPEKMLILVSPLPFLLDVRQHTLLIECILVLRQ